MSKCTYEELFAYAKYLRFGKYSEIGLPVEIKQLLLAMAPTCDRCGQATDNELEWLGMGPVICRCWQRERMILARKAVEKLPPQKHSYFTEIEINALVRHDTKTSNTIINRESYEQICKHRH